MPVWLRNTIFSLNSFVAAMLALYIAFSLGLERPFWAMMTVYITSNPLTGAVRSKAVFRLGGTILGGIATVAMVPVLVQQPVLLSIALTLWVGVCLFISLLDRTPRSYMFMLAGYTAAIIGFASVDHPLAIFDTAVLRVQEIGLGVLCSALVHSVIFPSSVSAVLSRKLTAVLGDAENMFALSLDAERPADIDNRRARLASDATELHILATHLPYDTARIRPTQAMISAFQDRLIMMLPLASAVEDRIASLQEAGGADSDVAALVADVRAWVGRAEGAPHSADLLARSDALADRESDARDWRSLLSLSLVARLQELVLLLHATRIIASQVANPEQPVPAELPALVANRYDHPLHRDYGMALLSTAAAVICILAICAFWILAAWPEGSVAALMAAIVCCFFSTMDDPRPAQTNFLVWTTVSLPLAAVYLFAIMPRLTDFPMLVMALFPALFVIGLAITSVRHSSKAMPIVMGFVGGLAITETYSADFAQFVNSNTAQLIGMAAAIAMTGMFRTIGADTAIMRIRRAGWRDLASAASAQSVSVGRWTSRMLDRLSLIGARIGQVDPGERWIARSALREIRVGINLLLLRDGGDRHTISSDTAGALNRDISRYFADRVAGKAGEDPPHSILDRIDDGLRQAFSATDRQARRSMLIALTGLRRNLFPSAPQFSTNERTA